jgi:riboflavin kinase/FMN adenylyltransferase
MTTSAPRAPLKLTELPSVGPVALSMGVFDGVHLGHQRLLASTRAAATERGIASIALVFDPPPLEVLRPGVAVPRLASLAANLEMIEATGVDAALPLRFDAGLGGLAADEFIDALGPALEPRALVMTPDSSFGRHRGGTAATMRRLGARRGFEVVDVDLQLVDGRPISSTRIRDAIADGDLAVAAGLLGRPPALSGTVVVGDRRGRQLGFPTANLGFDHSVATPPLGIYVGRASVPERQVGPAHPALVSVGVRPTFHEDGRVLVEVYLLDFDGDLYGAQLTVSLEARLRPERRFDSVPALVEQMRTDERDARRFLGIPT